METPPGAHHSHFKGITAKSGGLTTRGEMRGKTPTHGRGEWQFCPPGEWLKENHGNGGDRGNQYTGGRLTNGKPAKMPATPKESTRARHWPPPAKVKTHLQGNNRFYSFATKIPPPPGSSPAPGAHLIHPLEHVDNFIIIYYINSIKPGYLYVIFVE